MFKKEINKYQSTNCRASWHGLKESGIVESLESSKTELILMCRKDARSAIDCCSNMTIIQLMISNCY